MTSENAHRWLWLLLAITALALGVHLNTWGVLETSEARYAEIGREMLAGHDWLHPRLLGIQHFHKPPLTYWLTAASLALTGGPATAAGVRLLPLLAVLAQVALVYGLGALLFEGDRVRALAAAVVYATLPVVLISALNLTTDAYLATWELAATYGLLRFYQSRRPGWLYLFWLMLGLAFLTKGPVGFVLPLMAVAGFYFRRRPPRQPFTVHHALGFLLFVGVGISWYGYLVAKNPAFARYFLFEQTVERFANPDTFARAKPWWYYLVLAPATSLPWSAALMARALRTPWTTLPPIWRNVLLFGILVPLGFFSLSGSKLLLYILPIFPGVALLTVYYLGRCTDAELYRWYAGFLLFFGVILALLTALPAVAAAWELPLEASLLVAVWAAAGAGALALQHMLWQPVRVAPRLLVLPVIFTAFLLLTAKIVLSENELRFNGTRPLAVRLARPDLAGRPVVIYNKLLPSLAFALGRVPISLYDGEDALRRETQFEKDQAWQRSLINLQDSTAPRQLASTLWGVPPVLLSKGALPPGRQWLRAGLEQEEQIGPWHLYYAPKRVNELPQWD